MTLPRAFLVLVAGAAPLRASRSESTCPPSAECADDGVHLVQTRYVRDRREAAVGHPGAEGGPTPGFKEPAPAEAGAAGAAGKLRGAQQRPGSLAAVRTEVVAQGRKNGPKEAGWFQAFSEGESTYDTDGELQSFGWDSNWAPGEDISAHLYTRPTPMPGEWFQESKSGGPTEAWQTFYPAVPDAMPREQPNAGWQEALYGGSQATESKGPTWFDTAVGGYDAFGRPRAPSSHSQRRYIEWDRRTQKVNLTCGAVGCVANATFPQLFNHSEEQRRLCQLSIAIHATDFDDEYSRERVEFFKANGETVGVDCDPMTSGNTKEAQEALYPCVNELDVDKLIKDDGQLIVQGKLSSMVDEFPRNGNLLDGEATVSCLVRKRPEWHPAEPNLVPLDSTLNSTLASLFKKDSFSARFGCKTPGCVAETILEVGESMVNRTCKLTVKISQTDFDGDMGTHEQVDFLKVNGKAIKENVRPGMNPCKQAAGLGQPPLNTSQLLSGDLSNMSGSADEFLLADAVDVSEDAKTGKITIAAKISDMVDECGQRGLLLSGIAVVRCEIDEQQQQEIEAVLHGASGGTSSTLNASDGSANGAADGTADDGSTANASETSSEAADETGGGTTADANATEGGSADSGANASGADPSSAAVTEGGAP